MQVLRAIFFLAICFLALSYVLAKPAPKSLKRAWKRCYKRGGCGPEVRVVAQPVYQQPVHAAPPQQAPIKIIQKQNTIVEEEED